MDATAVRNVPTIIPHNSDAVTVIEVLKVHPSHQPALLNALRQAAEALATYPGFVSVSLHRGLDNLCVAQYVQWQNEVLFNAAYRSSTFQHYVTKYRQFVRDGVPRIYDVVYTKPRRGDAVTTIRSDYQGLTGINEVTTRPEVQQQLTNVMIATDKFADRVPGFRSTNTHCSHDGLRNINYLQCDNPLLMKIAVRALLTLPGPQRRALRFGQPDVHLYKVIFAHAV